MIKLRSGPPKFSYGVIEKALAVAYGIPEERRPGGFRSALNNLQRLGALGPNSHIGRGAALVYTHTEYNRLILTLEFCEFGIPPATAVALVTGYWESNLKAIIGAAQDPIGILPDRPEGDDVILCVRGIALRTAGLRGEAGPVVPNIDRCALAELPTAAKQWMAGTPGDPSPPRAMIANLSARCRAFHTALGVEFLAEATEERRAALVGKQLPKTRKARK
jgi:hypothetical protein